jgi:hypothetical protein
VTGRTSSGIGIWGSSTATSGDGTGIRGNTNSSAGYSGYFTGGRFYINGNVGIGASSPDCKMHIVAPDDGGDVLKIVQPTTGNYIIRMRESTSTGSGLIYVYDALNNPNIQLYAEGATYFNGGNVGVGLTNPAYTLDVEGDFRVKTIRPYVGGGNPVYWLPGLGVFNWATSDISLKENIEPLLNSLDKLVRLNGISYNYIEDTSKRRYMGLIAQEVEKIFPELVYTNPTDNLKGIYYAEMAAVLTEAIKELKGENDRLKSENEEILLRLEKLEAKVGK